MRRESYGETLSAGHVDPLFREYVWDRSPFVAAYGATRGHFGSRSVPKYSIRDSTATLFDSNASLQNPELSLRRQINAGRHAIELLHRLDQLLLIPPGSTQLTNEGLVIGEQLRGNTGLAGLSEGYRSTLTWVVDLLGWSMEHAEASIGPALGERAVSGIVIVDEIEQHLHPSWQRRIIRQLRDQFPDVQFVVSTHAPLCVVGTTDLEDRDVALCVVRDDRGVVSAICDVAPPRGQRADQVVTSFLFGLDSSGDNATQAKIARLSRLLSVSNPDPSLQSEIATLEHELEQLLGSDETELSSLVAKKIREADEEQFRTHWKAATFEARRQLADAAAKLADESVPSQPEEPNE